MTQSDGNARLRKAIDKGETGDKIPYPDPAAAPLGTDQEAAGTPLTRRAVAAAIANGTVRHTKGERPDASGPWTWALVVVGLLVVLAAAAALWWPATG